MPPVRRHRANKVKDKNQLGPGDLVLAKYKGLPPWPAKISRPEDWKLSPDPEKYFVQFFGTQETGFVAPADIQAFTNEIKSKLYARCQRKTVKCFAQAVKEICVAFDKIDKKAFDQYHHRQGELKQQEQLQGAQPEQLQVEIKQMLQRIEQYWQQEPQQIELEPEQLQRRQELRLLQQDLQLRLKRRQEEQQHKLEVQQREQQFELRLQQSWELLLQSKLGRLQLQ